MKQLGLTSIEQSKKLLEAGLDPQTADMHYIIKTVNHSSYEKYVVIVGKIPTQESIIKRIPCWSLGALIELVPESINENTKSYCQLEFSKKSIAYHHIDGSIIIGFLKDNLIDAVYFMILFLLENNYIKKGETK